MSSINKEDMNPIESFYGGTTGPDSDPHRRRNGSFHTFCQIFQNLFSNLFFFGMLIGSIWCHLSARKTWTPLNHSKGDPHAPIWTPVIANKWQFHTFAKFFKIFSVTCFFVYALICSIWCHLSAIWSWTTLNHSMGVFRALIQTPRRKRWQFSHL